MINLPLLSLEAESLQNRDGGPFNHPMVFAERLAQLRSMKIPVLGGFVQLQDVMGHERDVAAAARVTSQMWDKLPADDVNLIRYLMRHRHTTPFEMVELKFHVRVACDTWRQWIRHRMASVNEYSTRYSEAIDACQTAEGKWRAQATVNRQGSDGLVGGEWPEGYTVVPVNDEHEVVSLAAVDHSSHKLWGVLFRPQSAKPGDASEITDILHGTRDQITPAAYLTERESSGQHQSREIYEERLRFNVAKELARKDLPLSTMTEAIWKIDLHNLMHFLGLRMDKHAQLEIRTYANVIGEIVKILYPVTWAAFEEYRLYAMSLTVKDISSCQSIMSSGLDAPISRGAFLELCHPSWHGLERCRERDECETKLRRLGLVT